MVVLIVWSLAANNQKAKIIFKSAQLDLKLQHVIQHYKLCGEKVPEDDLNIMNYVLNMIKHGEKVVGANIFKQT